MRVGVIYGGARQYDEAESALSAALKFNPDDVQTLRAIARVARARGEFEEIVVTLSSCPSFGCRQSWACYTTSPRLLCK